MSKENRLWEAATHGDLDTVVSLTSDENVNVNWKDPEVGRTPLYRACFHGHSQVVHYLLSHPKVDPTLTQIEGATPFLIACEKGHAYITRMLLDDPRVDVNQRAAGECTPFSIACEKGQLSVVTMLLADQRIDLNRTSADSGTPLWFASHNGHLSVVQVMLASGRHIDTKTRSTFNDTTAAEQGRAIGRRLRGTSESDEDFSRRRVNGPIIAGLIDSFEKDPDRVKRELRRLPAIRGQFIGFIYSLIVLVTDAYMIPSGSAPSNTSRFFNIASQLPLELQMVLSNRMFGSGQDSVKMNESEHGFEWAFLR